MIILVIDIETTALKHWQGSIAEIGGVFLDTITGETTKAFSHIIKEAKPIDHEAWLFKNTDMTPELIKSQGVTIPEIKKGVQYLFDKYLTIAYNQQFDFGWLRSRGFKIEKTTIDPMAIATNILKISRYNGSYKWPKVQECLDYFGFDEDEPHRAYEDANLEAKIVYKLIQMGKYPKIF